jgi:ankyrin repeat protein
MANGRLAEMQNDAVENLLHAMRSSNSPEKPGQNDWLICAGDILQSGIDANTKLFRNVNHFSPTSATAPGNSSLLHFAVALRNPLLVTLLLQRGANLALVDTGNLSALEHAIMGKQPDVINAFLDFPAIVIPQEILDRCLVLCLKVFSDEGTIKKLFAKGASPHVSLAYLPATPPAIQHLIGSDNLIHAQLLDIFLEAGANPMAVNSSGSTTIEFAAASRNWNKVLIFLQRTSERIAPDVAVLKRLFIACLQNAPAGVRADIAERILKKIGKEMGINDLTTKMGAGKDIRFYPLHQSVMVNDERLTTVLLTHGADAAQKNYDGTAIELAASRGQWRMVPLFLAHPNHGLDPETLGNVLCNASEMSDANLQLALVPQLLAAKARIDAANARGKTTLEELAVRQHWPALALFVDLLEKDHVKKDSFGVYLTSALIANNPLSLAFAKKLISLGVNPNLEVARTRPLLIAAERNDKELLSSLLAAGADASLVSSATRKNAIEILAELGAWDTVADFLDAIEKLEPARRPSSADLGKALWHAFHDFTLALPAPVPAWLAPAPAPAPAPALPLPSSEGVIRSLMRAKATVGTKLSFTQRNNQPMCTTLHLAVLTNNSDLMALALFYGANPKATNYQNQTAATFAKSLGPTQTAAYSKAMMQVAGFAYAKIVVLSLHHHFQYGQEIQPQNAYLMQLPEELLVRIEAFAFGELFNVFSVAKKTVRLPAPVAAPGNAEKHLMDVNPELIQLPKRLPALMAEVALETKAKEEAKRKAEEERLAAQKLRAEQAAREAARLAELQRQEEIRRAEAARQEAIRRAEAERLAEARRLEAERQAEVRRVEEQRQRAEALRLRQEQERVEAARRAEQTKIVDAFKIIYRVTNAGQKETKKNFLADKVSYDVGVLVNLIEQESQRHPHGTVCFAWEQAKLHQDNCNEHNTDLFLAILGFAFGHKGWLKQETFFGTTFYNPATLQQHIARLTAADKVDVDTKISRIDLTKDTSRPADMLREFRKR